MAETIPVTWIDHKGEEVELPFYDLAVKPAEGETIHYWQDGTPEAAGVDSGIRRDFKVLHVEHDLRHLPERTIPDPFEPRTVVTVSQELNVHTLVVTVREIVKK